MAEEFLDICDENNNLTGFKEKRSIVDRDGLWHRSAHVWIYNSKGEILLQMRARRKRLYPDMWDVSAAGHVRSGELPIVSALRELEEELGLKRKEKDLQFHAIGKASMVYKDIKNNEFYYVYLMRYEDGIKRLRLQSEEVKEVRFFSIDWINEGLRAEPERFVPHGDYWSMVLKEVKRKLFK